MKLMLVGDLHYGEKGNSEKFNTRVTEFLEWACSLKDEYKVDTFVQLGDWYHSRHKIDVSTMNHGINGAKVVSGSFGKDNGYVILGNHDLYYLNRLDVNSISNTIGEHLNVVDKLYNLDDDTLLCPWITTEELWDDAVSRAEKSKYLIAHLELNGFYVTETYKMEHGFSPKELKKFDYVFSGHYHSKQKDKNIIYVGTPYPITMSEANEPHGIHIFDTETQELEFIQYNKISVISIPYQDIDKIENYDPETTTIRIEFPDDLEDETLIEDYKKTLSEMNFDEVKIKYTPKKVTELIDSEEELSSIENIDAAVLEFLGSSTTVDGIDKDLLKTFYGMSKTFNELTRTSC